MLMTTDFSQKRLQESSRRFIITLTLGRDLRPTVRSCEILDTNFRNRTTFGDSQTIEDVFVDTIAAGVRDCLEGLTHKTEVLSRPDLVIEIDGLTLSGAHMIATRTDDGYANVILRFNRFLGGINKAFNNDIGFDSGLEEESSRLAALVLSDLSMPILDICEAMHTGVIGADDHLSAFRKEIADRSYQIKFQIELVRRFVERSDAKKKDPRTTGFDQRSAMSIDLAYDRGLLGAVG